MNGICCVCTWLVAMSPLGLMSLAGHPFEGSSPSGGAVRIFTGAVVPAGLDTVAMQEDVQVEERDGERWVTIPPGGIVRANSITLPKRQNPISWSLIFLHFSGSI